MKKIICLAIAFIAITVSSGCSSGDEEKTLVTEAKESQKTPPMIEFENGFKGISARMAVSPEAKEIEEQLIVSK